MSVCIFKGDSDERLKDGSLSLMHYREDHSQGINDASRPKKAKVASCKTGWSHSPALDKPVTQKKGVDRRDELSRRSHIGLPLSNSEEKSP